MASPGFPTPANVDATALSGAGWTALLTGSEATPLLSVAIKYTGDHPIEISFDNGTTTHAYMPGSGAAGVLGGSAQSWDFMDMGLTRGDSVKCRKLAGGSTPTVGRVMADGMTGVGS